MLGPLTGALECDIETGEWKEVEKSVERAPQVAGALRGGEVCCDCGRNAFNLCMKPRSVQETQDRAKHTWYIPNNPYADDTIRSPEDNPTLKTNT